MKVLTFGWDFPPHTTGGLGVACQGLTRELAKEGVEVLFVLPKSQAVQGDSRFIFADVERMVRTREINSSIAPYLGSQSLLDVYDEYGVRKLYQNTLLEEVHAFAHKASQIAAEEEFDLIHAHDWTSYLAGVAAKIVSGKPLVLHVHATAFDQAAGDNVDPAVFKIEKEAFAAADRILTVSNFTKQIIVEKHGADPDKVEVVHNGIDSMEPKHHEPTLQELRTQGKRIVLYHGRITIQKGVDYFIKAAQKVIEYDPNVVFVISGKGDMTGQIMQQVGALGLSQHVLFAGALWYEERDQMYQSVDLVVMPSVSEPFGLVPLEAIQHGTPSLISKQSGVSEIITHVLKVDFWDVDDMANKILAALRYPVMHGQLVKEGKREALRLSWHVAAKKVVDVYKRLLEWVTA
jgi:glycosyltransferase involved in cell wall biosynthesis